MIDLSSLEPDTRTAALAGLYLQHWASMENGLNRLLGECLELDMLTQVIVSKNIQLRDKIKITKTTLNSLLYCPTEEVEGYKSILSKISDISNDRNMVAHDMFLTSDDEKGVLFHVVKAAGKLKFPETIWNINDFFDRFRVMIEIREQLDEMCLKIKEARAIREAWNPKPQPANGILAGLGLLGSLSLPPQEHQNSPPANAETVDETQPTLPLPPQSGD